MHITLFFICHLHSTDHNCRTAICSCCTATRNSLASICHSCALIKIILQEKCHHHIWYVSEVELTHMIIDIRTALTKFYTPYTDYEILVLCTCTYLIFLSSLWKLGYMNYKIVLELKMNHNNQCNAHTYSALLLYHQHLCFFSSYSYLDHHSAYKKKLCIVTYVCVQFIWMVKLLFQFRETI